MIAIMSNGMISAKAAERSSPADALSGMNHPLFEKTNEDTYTALWIGALQVETRTLVHANAGFLAPLIKRGETVRSLESAGPRFPLGALPDTGYEESRVSIERADVIVLFTDGVTDARNRDHEFYECDCLMRYLQLLDLSSLSAREIRERILADVERFIGAAAQHDDMTVVVVKSL